MAEQQLKKLQSNPELTVEIGDEPKTQPDQKQDVNEELMNKHILMYDSLIEEEEDEEVEGEMNELLAKLRE